MFKNRKIAEQIKEIESVQYSEENAEKLEQLVTKLKEAVVPSEEAQLFFIKNGGLSLLLRNIEVSSAVSLLYFIIICMECNKNRGELVKHNKLCEELQKLHGFEAIVEYLYKKASNGKLVSPTKLKMIIKMLDVIMVLNNANRS